MPDGNPNPFPHMPEGFTGEPWNQWPGETGPAYRAFTIFRDLGRTRGMSEAYRNYSGNAVARHASTRFKEWRRMWDWDARAIAYDDRTERIADTARIDAITAIARRQGESEINWIEARQETRKKELEISSRLIEKAQDMLEIALIRRKVIPADPAAGRAETHIYEPAKWNFKTVVEFMELAFRLRRQACELPITIAKDDKPGAGSDDEGMFATTAGILEAAIPAGMVPAMPEDVNQPPTVRMGRDAGEDDLRQPMRIRPA